MRALPRRHREGHREHVMSAAMNPRLLRKIHTTHVRPPVPSRQYNWQAIFDGYEPGDSIGTGATEQEAIDWLIAEEAHLIASEHSKEPA